MKISKRCIPLYLCLKRMFFRVFFRFETLMSLHCRTFYLFLVVFHFMYTSLKTWTGTQALLSKSGLPQTHVAFLPFPPHPVTEVATVFTAMQYYVKLLNQLKQKSLPKFCDEGVFRLVLNIYLKCPKDFMDLVPMSCAFRTAKCV